MTLRRPLAFIAGLFREIPSGDAVPIDAGGTGATTAALARDGLGVTTALAAKANLSGAAFTGAISAPFVEFSGDQNAYLAFRWGSPGVPAWDLQRLPDTAGGDLLLTRYGLNGVYADNPLQIRRVGGIQVNTPLYFATYTLATLPSASVYNGFFIVVSNAAGGAKLCRSNGTVWQIANTTTTVS